MRISTKISTSLFTIAVVLLAVATAYLYDASKKSLTDVISAHLQATARSRASHVETFLNEYEQLVHLLSSHKPFTELLSINAQSPEYSRKLQEATRELNKITSVHLQITALTLLDTNGMVITSTQEALIGSDRRSDPSCLGVNDKTHIHDIHVSDIAEGEYAFSVASPILSNGTLLGVVVAHIDPKDLFEILLDRTGLGKTGEIYLVNKDKYIISPSRFRKDVILRQRIDAQKARILNSLHTDVHEEGTHDPDELRIYVFPDYRGVTVLGTHTHIPKMQWCLLAEVDKKEAFAPLAELRLVLVLVLVTGAVLAWLLGVLVSRLITKPIRALHHGAETIGAGNLDHKVGTSAKDEVGQLSRAFDAMTANLSKTLVSRHELEQSLSVTRSILESIQVGVLVVGKDKRIRQVNSMAMKMFGVDSREQIIGQECHKFICPAEKDNCPVLDLEQEVVNSERIMLDKDGNQIPILKTVVPIILEGEGVLLETFIDITERKLAEQTLHESEEKFRSLTEATSDWIWETDQNGVYSYASPKVKDLLGYDPQEIVAKTPFDLMPPDEAERMAVQFADIAKAKKSFDGLVNVNVHKNGRHVVIETSGVPILDSANNLLGFRGIDRDITERKKVDQLKNEFISTVSHELRTPLTSISGSLGLIVGGATGEISAKGKELLDIALRNSERLVLLINDILDIEGVESGKMEFELRQTEIMPIVEQAVRDNASYAAQHGVKLVLGESMPGGEVYADRNRVMQVMANLLSNAAKFSPENESVVTSVTRAGKYIRVSVKDNGPGIPESFRDRIFEKFAQADASDARQKGGTGLGLNVTKALIERMGGRIGFESQPGEGATFFIDLLPNIARNGK
ncbi:PAS domain S-box protein [Verrucomicrobiota bacterium]